jgi:hypothetical protein
MKKKLLTTIIASLFVFSALAQQFDLSAELRPRFENKQGYQLLLNTNQEGSNFVSQRTRLNFGFKNEKLKLKIVMQNVRVWGDVGTLSSDDKASALHETWAAYIPNNKISFKFGRQEIVYDDHRIFGNVGWAQQARSHDAFLFKYTPNADNKLDIGFALNADSQSNVDNLYSNAADYKSFQYAWYHGDFNAIGVSFLLLNTGIEYLDIDASQTIDYMQTIGPRLTYKSGKFNANVSAYLQTGKSLNNDVSTSYFAGNIGYKVTKEWSLGLGMEQLSGKDSNASSTDIKSFAPLFGTNHKFNGFMDYFYVGNHANSVGLTDINMTLGYSKDKFSAKLTPHLFSAAADVFDGTTKMDANLGTEIDLTVGYKIAKDINLNAGYSKLFATRTLEVLKGGDKNENNSWVWVMMTFKPTLFSHKAN